MARERAGRALASRTARACPQKLGASLWRVLADRCECFAACRALDTAAIRSPCRREERVFARETSRWAGQAAKYPSPMRFAHGTVVSGKVGLDESSLPEGAEVYVLSRDPGDPVRLSADELAELEAGLAEADCGETISGKELFERLHRHG